MNFDYIHNLSVLDLQDEVYRYHKRIKKEGAEALAEALKVNSSLTKLNL